MTQVLGWELGTLRSLPSKAYGFFHLIEHSRSSIKASSKANSGAMRDGGVGGFFVGIEKGCNLNLTFTLGEICGQCLLDRRSTVKGGVECEIEFE